MEDRRSRLPSEQEIAEINARHLIDTPIKPADLLFVFGTREDVARRVDEACRLWREGMFGWSIVSGGVTPGSRYRACSRSDRNRDLGAGAASMTTPIIFT